jgi:CBS domain-containing protein
MYTVGDVMTRKVVALDETQDLATAKDILSLARIRHLPVVRNGRLVGLLTQRDLLRLMSNQPEAIARGTLAREAMNRRLRTVRAATPLRTAIRLLLQNKYGCLPVVSGDGTLVGILTEADLARLAGELIAQREATNRQPLSAA